MSTASLSTVLLRPQQPYSFASALTYFRRRAGELVDRAEDDCYRRLFSGEKSLVLVELRPAADESGLLLTVRDINGLPASDADRELVAVTLTRTLGLDDDLTPFLAAVAGDRRLSELVLRHPGLRLVSTPAPFEAFVWAVLGQQISLHVAFQLKAALVRGWGVSARIDEVDYWAFPAPAALAAANPDELAALGIGRRKSATIVATAGAVASGKLNLAALAAVPLSEAEAELVALHGVGPWTAHYTLLRGLRLFDAIPHSDMGLRVACGARYGLGRKATVSEVEALAEHWRPYRGLAAFYLWFMLGELAAAAADKP